MLLDDNDNDDEELWRNIPSTSGTQKVKPAANEPIPGYPKLMKTQQQQQQQSQLYYNQAHRSVVNTAHFSSSSSSSSSSPSAGSYHPRPLNLVGQKRKREVTFIEMIKEGGGGGNGRSPPPLPRPSSSSTASNGGDGGEMGVLEEEEEEEEEEDDLLLLDDDADGIPARHSSKHQATELLQTRRRGTSVEVAPQPARLLVPLAGCRDHSTDGAHESRPPPPSTTTTSSRAGRTNIIVVVLLLCGNNFRFHSRH
ncbi:hypothetical protein TYRP_003084 [Tyrophagus putrescentiae]|nr:hypothetical protein TYRP_003084 [Tyrophagus putrescentiae]